MSKKRAMWHTQQKGQLAIAEVDATQRPATANGVSVRYASSCRPLKVMWYPNGVREFKITITTTMQALLKNNYRPLPSSI